MISPPHSPVAQLQLEAASPAVLARSLCLATGRPRYALSPGVVADTEQLSVDLSGPVEAVWRDGVAALGMAGIHVECAKEGLCRFFQPDRSLEQRPDEPQSVFTYTPRFRDVSFLSGQLAGMFSGWHFDGVAGGSGQAGAPQVSATVSPSSGSGGGGGGASAAGRAELQQAVATRLVGIGPSKMLADLQRVLPALDQPEISMTVRVAVYEVDDSKNTGSAIQFVLGVLHSTITLGASVVTAGASSLVLQSGNFQAVIAAMDGSNKAHLVTAPVLRTSSGTVASFAVGDSVPTLSSVSYAQGSSTPVQSIEYQQSGVVFSVLPVVVGGKVHLSLYQSVSSFQQTSTGVTQSPTLQNRALASQLVATPGTVLVLGGLVQTDHAKGTQGFLGIPLGWTSNKSDTSMVLVLSVGIDPS